MAQAELEIESADHTVSAVVPVYGGEKTLAELMAQFVPFTTPSVTADGHTYVVQEVVLVYDNGRDDSATVMRALEKQYPFVKAVWLSKNYGQHPATIAGMASAGGDWIVTIDEDLQHDPSFIASMLDTAMTRQADVVYALPTNEPPHTFLRNISSKGAKWVLNLLTQGGNAELYQSYRLVLGSIGRSVAAYAGSGVYLDIALGWVARKVVTSPVELRQEGDRQSGYNARRLISHFWKMVLSSGTRGLRAVAVIGAGFFVLAAALAVYIIIARVTDTSVPEGWASTIIAILVSTGTILFSLGIIAEYVGVAVGMAQGKPPYLIVRDPVDGPLGRPARFPR